MQTGSVLPCLYHTLDTLSRCDRFGSGGPGSAAVRHHGLVGCCRDHFNAGRGTRSGLALAHSGRGTHFLLLEASPFVILEGKAAVNRAEGVVR